MLCAVWHVLDPEHELFQPPYKKAYVNHPSTIWVRSSRAHYTWLCDLAKELCLEYTLRYDKTHASEKVVLALEAATNLLPESLSSTWEDPPQAMPDEFKDQYSSKCAYRRFYKFGKKPSLHTWKKRPVPYFMKSITIKFAGDEFIKKL